MTTEKIIDGAKRKLKQWKLRWKLEYEPIEEVIHLAEELEAKNKKLSEALEKVNKCCTELVICHHCRDIIKEAKES